MSGLVLCFAYGNTQAGGIFGLFWPFLASFGLFALSTKVMLISLNYRSTQKPLTALSTNVMLASFNYRLTKQPFLQ
jgi:hypothetical protein